MSFFDRARAEKKTDQESHYAFQEIKRIFGEEGIQLGDDMIAKICSHLPKLQAWQCTGRCDYDLMLFVGEASSLACSHCGRPMKLVPVNLSETSLPKEARDEMAGIGHFHHALAKLHANDVDEAIASFTKAILFKPAYVDAYYNRSEARMMKGDCRGAIDDCDSVIRLNPNDADAYLNRGSAKAQLDDYAGCLSDTDTALRLGFKKPVAHLNRGICLLHLGRAQEARKALETFITVAPNDPRSRNAQAMISLHCE